MGQNRNALETKVNWETRRAGVGGLPLEREIFAAKREGGAPESRPTEDN